MGILVADLINAGICEGFAMYKSALVLCRFNNEGWIVSLLAAYGAAKKVRNVMGSDLVTNENVLRNFALRGLFAAFHSPSTHSCSYGPSLQHKRTVLTHGVKVSFMRV